MFGIVVCYPLVGFPFVGVDGLGVTCYVLAYEALQGLPVPSANHLKANSSIALKRPHNDRLVALVPASLTLYLTAHESLIGFYDALQELGIYFFKGGADAMVQVPGGSVSSADGALELV